MPVIKPRTTQKQFARFITRLYRENNELLFAYAKFIAEPTEYVVNQLVETVLGRDKEFQAWRAEHPEPASRNPASGRSGAAGCLRRHPCRQRPPFRSRNRRSRGASSCAPYSTIAGRSRWRSPA